MFCIQGRFFSEDPVFLHWRQLNSQHYFTYAYPYQNWSHKTSKVCVDVIMARLCNHYWRDKKAVNITYSGCVSVALGIQHAMRMRRVILSPVAFPTLHFSTLSHKRHGLRVKGIEHTMCVLIFSTTFVWNISHAKKNSARFCHKCSNFCTWNARYSCQILIKSEFSVHVLKKYSNIIFHENPSSASRVIPCERTVRHDSLTVAFRNSVNVPKNNSTK